MNENEIRRCIDLMESLASSGSAMDDLTPELRVALLSVAGRLSRPARDAIRVRNKEILRARRQKRLGADKQTRSQTGIREARKDQVFQAPRQIQATTASADTPELLQSRNCYVCKTEYRQIHFFYDSMCGPCADLNYKKRFQTADLRGQVALITGARLKIGYQAALMMLRAGARVIVTTRFPVDAALRYAAESDFAQWGDRLQVHGLDLRHTPSVEIFASFIEQQNDRLDILINNAAQTVKRPPGFYAHLMARETEPFANLPPPVSRILTGHLRCVTKLGGGDTFNGSHLPSSWHGTRAGVGILDSARLSQIPYAYDESGSSAELFPVGQLDADLQQVDRRQVNSWRLALADVPTLEMLEVQLVNAVAPFVLCSRLAPLMRRVPTGQKHIVNVTAMEGKFSRYTKTDKHPHTNMAKAALNMLTHTSARDLVKDGIYMNAVDTGWVTDEDPLEISKRKQDVHDFQPPLDIVDGAARVCDPFFDGITTGKHWCGKFLKDYFPTDW